MDKTTLVQVMREGVPEWGKHGQVDICNRKFIVYYSAKHDWRVAKRYIGNRCYRRFTFGQMENYTTEFGGVGYISTPAQVLAVIRKLRKMGMRGKLDVCVEYVDGYFIYVKSFGKD